MSVRLKLALAVFATGLVSALLVVATVVYAFQRFENETASRRGLAFLDRVGAMYGGEIAERRAQSPLEFERFLRSLVLYAPDTELYLLDGEGVVLAKTGVARLPPGFKVAIGPVRQSVEKPDMPYVMGDDPERMDANAVVVARALPAGGYLYLVLHTQLPEGRWAALFSSFSRPALGLVVAVIAITTLAAVLLVAAVTRPLQQLTSAVAGLSERGLDQGLQVTPQHPLPAKTGDEFGRLTSAFEMLLDVCRRQWDALRRTDHFRREAVSNLSHDLRSPLTATVACLETLDNRWTARAVDTPDRDDDLRLVGIALRNTRNAAGLVRSLGDLAKLDEPSYAVRAERVDVGELIDDVALRFAERAESLGVALVAEGGDAGDEPATAAIDVELFERALANLVGNALQHGVREGMGGTVRLSARRDAASGRVVVAVADDGPGIAAADLPHLFDRFYQSRTTTAPAGADGGRGLGLAIVKRVVELHGGEVAVESATGAGTRVVVTLPDARAASAAPRESPRASIRGGA